MPRSIHRSALTLLWVLTSAPLALALAAESVTWPAGTGFPLDDTWIHLQFGRVMAAGEGLGYNHGEPALGTTAPLWSALLALGHHLPGEAAAWALLFGLAAHVVLVFAVLATARRLRLGHRAGMLAAAWVATSGWLVWSSVSGMEVSLFALVSLLGLCRADLELEHPKTLPVALPLLAVSSLLRPEALLLVGLAVVELGLHRRWRQLVSGAALAALVLGPWICFAWLSTGSPLPTTYAVKAGGGDSLGLPALAYLRSVFWVLFQFQPMVPLLAGGGVLWLAARATRQPGSVLAAAWLIALPLALGAHDGGTDYPIVGNFGRYFFPLLPVAALLAAASASALLRSLRLRSAVIAAALLVAPGAVLVGKAVGLYATNLANVRDGDLEAALWLAERLPDGASIAVNDIGLLKYLLPEHRVLDLVGISHPQVREYGARAAALGLPWWRGILAFLADEQPDYVVAFSSWLPQLAYTEGFVPLRQFTIPKDPAVGPANITMGGDEIVVWATPWTRAPLRGESMEPIELDWVRPWVDPDQLEDHLE